MQMTERDACIHCVEESYFSNVRAGNLDLFLACFRPGAEVIIRHCDNAERVFSAGSGKDAVELAEFYQHLCGNYSAWFGNFVHFIDLEAQKSACHFKVRLTPKDKGLYAGAGTQELQNCNFFEYRDGLINHMIIYYSNSGAGGADVEVGGRTPTGYPA